MSQPNLGWVGVVRLGLVQTALGSIVVLATSVMNRVMVVELALPALVPGGLVALHYGVQLLRPRMGYNSDRGGRQTPIILGGVAVLGGGAILASISTALMSAHLLIGLATAVLGFCLIGVGVGAAGTCLLVLLAKRTEPRARPLAATVVWLMMIGGFVITTVCAGRALDPFSSTRLVVVTSVIALTALSVSVLALLGIEKSKLPNTDQPVASEQMPPFRAALAEVWAETPARQLAIFIFVSMLAYSAEELLLDPFAGSVYGYTPGQSTQLSGALHGGVFIGMLTSAIFSSSTRFSGILSMARLMMIGCSASALALLGLASAGFLAPAWPLQANVFILGLANGVFAVSALGSMMMLAGSGGRSREGVRMGLWGAAQGIAFGCGGIVGSGASDLAKFLLERRGPAYGAVFLLEALTFVAAALIAMRMQQERPAGNRRFGRRLGPLSIQ